MKKFIFTYTLFLSLNLLILPFLNAQLFFTKTTIDADLNGAYFVKIVDVDGDLDQDILATGYIADDVVWYENVPAGFTKHIIDGNLNGVCGIDGADLDGDTDIDIIAAGNAGDQLILYRNDGTESFTKQTIASSYDGVWDVKLLDLDADTDVDIISTAIAGKSIDWWENDGTGSFTKHQIAAGLNGPHYVNVKDVDDTNGLDILATAYTDNDVLWWQNDGSLSFTSNIIDNNLSGAILIDAADLDGDNDMDFYVSGGASDELVWYENDGSENFSAKNVIASTLDDIRDLSAYDLDGDSDLDIVCSTYADDDLLWFENDGSANFTKHFIDDDLNGAYNHDIGDIDGNGTPDIVASGRNADDIILYSLNIQEHWYVDSSATGSDNGSSWVNAFTNLQSALDTADAGDTIRVAKGTYLPHGSDQRISFVIPTGAVVIGGFPSGGGTREWRTHRTVLSGEINTTAKTDNTNIVVLFLSCESSTVLDGFYITDGYADDASGNYDSGAGLYLSNSPGVQLRNLVIHDNLATDMGGGLFLYQSKVAADHIIFHHNTANYGGAIALENNNGNSSQFINVLFAGNHATTSRGAFHYRTAIDSDTLHFINCTMAHNTGANAEGCGRNDNENVKMINTIIWGNSSPSTDGITGSNYFFENCILQDRDDPGTQNVDPQFNDPSDFDFSLNACSPAIDAGDNNAIIGIVEDVGGNPRIYNTTVDIGAYEFQSAGSSTTTINLYVDSTATGGNTGLSWTNAFTDLQLALTYGDSFPCKIVDTIFVASGTYFPSTSDRSLSFEILNGMKVIGGYPTGGGVRNWTLNPTILSGEINNLGSTSDNTYNIVRAFGVDSSTLLDGFYIRYGFASSSYDGGGVSLSNSDIALRHLSIESNYCSDKGGGIRISSGSPVIVDCIFKYNSAYSYYYGDGGAIHATNGNPKVYNCLFLYNSTRGNGSAIFNQNGSFIVSNSTFYNNNSWGNSSEIRSTSSTMSITNCIFWNNIGKDNIITFSGTPPTVSYSILKYGYAGTGNLDDHPLFVDALNKDFRLQSCSPGVNSGDNNALPAWLSEDIEGNVRQWNSGTVDMGCFEYQGASSQPLRTTLYVDSTASSGGDGLTWVTAFDRLEDAFISYQYPGACHVIDTIKIAKGTYYPTSRTNRDSTFLIEKNLVLYGGYPTGGGSNNQRDWISNPTILSGNIGESSTGDNSRHVITARRCDTAVIDGLIIQEGRGSNGAGMNITESNVFIRNSVFRLNRYEPNGAAIYANYGMVRVTNSLFYDNDADYGGIIMGYYSDLELFNNTITNNENSGSSNGTVWINHGSLKTRNCILWNNGTGPEVASAYATMDIAYNLIGGGYTGGTRIIDENPFFSDPLNKDFSIQSCSPAKDAGDTTDLPGTPPLDFAMNSRMIGDSIDMGCYESQSLSAWTFLNYYVDINAPAGGNGYNWSTAFNDLHQALNRVHSPLNCEAVDTIFVAQGTYYPAATGKDTSFVLTDSVVVMGGYDASTGLRDLVNTPSILSGDINILGTSTDNSQKVLRIYEADSTSVLDGFIIRDGYGYVSEYSDGSGIHIELGSKTTIRNVTIRNNQGYYGALKTEYSSPRFVNCLFTKNHNARSTIYNDHSTPTFVNITASKNTITNESYGTVYNASSTVTISNSILWENIQTEINNNSSTCTIDHSIIEHGYPGTNNLNINPMFIDLLGLDFHLQSCSPAIETGDGSKITGFNDDLDGHTRSYGVVDIGCYEYQGSKTPPAYTTIYVDSTNMSGGNGLSWANAYADLQQALLDYHYPQSCRVIDTIKIAKGTYYPALNDRDSTFLMERSLVILGGYPTGGGTLRNWESNPAILSGDIGTIGTNTDNSKHVLTAYATDLDMRIDGVIIQDGRGSYGGGLRVENGTGKVRNSLFRYNQNEPYGSALYIENANVEVIQCVFTDNHADYQGIIMAKDGSLDIINSTISGNTIPTSFSTIYIDKDSLLIRNSIMWNNGTGTEIIVGSGWSDVAYCLITGGFTGTDNINIDPDFLDAANDNYRISGCSKAKNSGINSAISEVNDFDLMPRFYQGKVDIGAYEYNAIPWVFVTSCSNQTIYLDAAGEASITTSMIDNGTISICGLDTMYLSETDFSCLDTGANTVRLFFDDVNENSDSCEVTITVLDTIKPTPLCQGVTIYLDGFGQTAIDSNALDNGSSDNCTIASFSLSQSAFNCNHKGVNLITMTVEDVSGNWDVCQANVTVFDTIPPVQLCKNVTIFLDGSGQATIDSNSLDNGSNDNCEIVSISVDKAAFNCFEKGPNPVVMTVTDDSANSSTCLGTVTVLDSIAPLSVCQNVSIYLDASGQASIDSTSLDNGSSDNCEIVSVEVSKSGFECQDVGPNAVIMTVTDGSANSNTCQSTVTVFDTIKPTPMCKNVTIYLDSNGQATIDSIAVDNASSDNCTISSFSLSQSSFICSEKGMNSITMTVEDVSGNLSTCQATITVEDTIPPIAICQNLTIYLDPSGQVTIDSTSIDNGTTDNCEIVSFGVSRSDFGCEHVGQNMVIMTVTDNSANSKTCQSTVTVLDEQPPIPICQNIDIYLDENGNGSILPAMIDNGSYDVCTPVQLNLDQTTFNCSQKGANAVILTVTDDYLNINTCQATVNVFDTLPPIISGMPSDMLVYTSPGTCEAPVSWNAPGITDNCTGVTRDSTHASGSLFPRGTTDVIFTATDAENLITKDTFSITVIDNIPPSAKCRSIAINLEENASKTILPDDIDDGTSDNCTLSNVTISQSVFDCGNLGDNSVLLIAIDESGNRDTCQATVTVSAIAKYYVDQAAPGGGDGKSWATAFNNLQDALSYPQNCEMVDTVFIANGTYYAHLSDRSASFEVKSGIVLMGGYSSGSPARDPEANPTILSGDIGVPGDSTDNSFHVIKSTTNPSNDTIILDGIMIEKGQADGSGAQNNDEGAAIYNTSKMLVRNCIVRFNSGVGDGSIVINKGADAMIILEDCTMLGNVCAAGSEILNLDNALMLLLGLNEFYK